ncbi:M57 family metalloprotease [Fulvivirga ligni]|uniref:M57 family metalloprotease n=1 Tax=Fulvivirga ligni TaxID=2904246 RepID=UPI001F305932|nr:M57 family metalloprotease [Fulvivirga ligni]UII21395.1 M57 family metalloprotease [Fulvivirga ligni]
MMNKKTTLFSGVFFILMILMVAVSCNDETEVAPPDEPLQIGENVMNQFLNLGFDPSDMRSEMFYNPITKESKPVYVLENDIMVSPEELAEMQKGNDQSQPKTEQYRTTNLVTGNPRTITVLGYYATGSNASYLDATMRSALQMAVENYNNLNLGLTFTLSFGTNSAAADIVVYRVSGAGGGQAGFPSAGNPYKWAQIQSGTTSYGLDVVEHVITHEMGHCVGLRHTDYFNRSISCGAGGNEGPGTYGAIHIPGTPAQPSVDLNSIMLACFNSSVTGEFSSYDATALTTLYPGGTTPPPTDPTLTVTPTLVTFGSSSGSRTINVSSNVSWSVSDNQSWISLSASGGANNGTFVVTVSPYNMLCEPPRTGTVTINGGSAGSQSITVRQTARRPGPGEYCP